MQNDSECLRQPMGKRKISGEYKIYRARDVDIDGGFFWLSEQKPEPVVKLSHNGKSCHLQLRKVDDTLSKHHHFNNFRHEKNIALISAHYRSLLGIEYKSSDDATNKNTFTLDIITPGKVKKIWYHVMACWCHPDPYVKTALLLGFIGLALGIIGLILGIKAA